MSRYEESTLTPVASRCSWARPSCWLRVDVCGFPVYCTVTVVPCPSLTVCSPRWVLPWSAWKSIASCLGASPAQSIALRFCQTHYKSEAPLKVVAAIQAPQLVPRRRELPSHGSLWWTWGPQGLELTSGFFVTVQQLRSMPRAEPQPGMSMWPRLPCLSHDQYTHKKSPRVD